MPALVEGEGNTRAAVRRPHQAQKPDVLRWCLAAAAVLLACALLLSRQNQTAAPTPDAEVAQQTTPPSDNNKGAHQVPPEPQIARQEDVKAPTVSVRPEQAIARRDPPAPVPEPEVVQAEMPDWEEEFVDLPAPLDERSAPAVVQEKQANDSDAARMAALHGPRASSPPVQEDGNSARGGQDGRGPGPRASSPPVRLESLTHGRPAREQISDTQGLAVLRRTGALVVYEPEQRIWRTVQSGEAVPYGARLRTGAGAQAELAFGESRLWLDAASDLVVARAADGSRRVALDHGRLRIDLLRPDAGFSIESGGGVVELTGTIVEVEAAAPRLAFIRTLEGHARVRPAGVQNVREAIQVSAGEEALLAVPGAEPLAGLPAAFRDRVKELSDAPDKRLAFKPATEDWTKDLKKPASKSRAVGQLLVKDAAGRPAEPLHIARLSVEARIRGAAALTRVDQSFRNDTDSTLEGTFYFPLPPGAALSRFAMFVDNEQRTLIEGEVVEREYARNVYESILRQKRDPALVEWMEGNLFKARIFPIPPRSLKRVILEYTQLLPATFDTRRYVFPLVSELTSKTPIDVFSLRAILETGDGTPFHRIESPSYPMTTVEGQDRRIAMATLALRDLQPCADFVLAISAPRRGEITGEVYGESGEPPYVLLGYQPRPEAAGDWERGRPRPLSGTEKSEAAGDGRGPGARASSPPVRLESLTYEGRDILFVVETSGARTSSDLDTQSQILRAVLAGLDPLRDRVALAAADVSFIALTPGWVNLYSGRMVEAHAALDRRAPLGALDLENALSSAADFAARNHDEKREQMVVFIGSGVPSLGTLDAAVLTESAATKFSVAGVRFSSFAVGRTVDSLILSALARRTNGLYLPLKGDEDQAETAFLAALSLQTPWIEAPVLSAEGATLSDVRPDELGSVLPGQEVFLHARLQETLQSFDVSVAGQLNGKPYASRATLKVPLKLNANPAVGRFWARAQLDHLLARPQTPQLQQEVVRLAKTWTLMTPYTSFLVLESEQDYVRYEIKREQRRRIWREDADIFSEPEKEDTTALLPPVGETPELQAERLLGEAKQLTAVPDQARLADAEAELEAGERFFKKLEYAEAKKHFDRAALLDPTNLRTLEYVRKTNAALGIRTDPFHDRLAQLEQSERVRIQEQVAILATALQDGERFETRGEQVDLAVADSGKEQILADQLDNLRFAELHYRRVKEVLNYMPTNFDMPNERRVVNEGIRRVKEKIAAKEDEVSFLRRQEAARIAEEQGLHETLYLKQRIQKLGDEVKALQARGEFRSAEKLAIRILQLDPLNQEAETMKRQARAAQHEIERKDRIQSVIQKLENSQNVSVEEKLALLDHRLDLGRRYIEEAKNTSKLTPAQREERLQQAQDAFMRARELTKWMPQEVNVNEQKREAERMMEEVQKARAAPAPGFTKTPPDTTSATFGTVGSLVGGEARVPGSQTDLSKELETLKREVEELRARIGAERGVSREAGKDWQVETGYSLNDSIWKGTVLNDQDVKNKYGPDATVQTKQGKLTIGGLAQVWYDDPAVRERIEKDRMHRNADGSVSFIRDYEVSGDAFNPVIETIPAAEYEALRRKVQQDRYTAGLNYYIRGENAKASVPTPDTRRAELERKQNELRDEMMNLQTRQDRTKEGSAEEDRNLAAQVQDFQRREFELKRQIRELDQGQSSETIKKKPAELAQPRLDANFPGPKLQTEAEKQREAVSQTWETANADHIPYGDLLVYPSNWDEIAKRPERMAISGKVAEEQWKLDMRKQLQRKVSFNFIDTPLQDAITFLRNLSNVTMIVDPKVIEKDPRLINLRVTDMSLDLALGWILRLADLDYAFKDKAVFISRKENLVEDVELRIYDVSDITGTIIDMPGPDLKKKEEKPPKPDPVKPDETDDAAAGEITAEQLAEVIRTQIKADSWDATKGTSIDARSGRLVVMQRPEVHALINRFLEVLRTPGANRAEPLRNDPKDPPAPPPGTDGSKADEKKDPAEATAKARKLLQEAIAALPRTEETARQRLRLFAELASLSSGADVYQVLNDGIANFGGEGPYAEALAKVFLQTILNEKDAAALEAALAFITDPVLRGNLAVRCGELTTDVERRLGLFARAYRASPNLLRTYVVQLVKVEKNKEAIALLKEALRNGSGEAWIVPQLNELYGRTRDDAGLLRVLTLAVAQRPREAQGRLELARALNNMGRGVEALRELRLAREFRPEDLPVHSEYLALAERLQDRAAIEDALWGLLDRDWPGGAFQREEAQKRWKKLADEYRDAGQDAKAKELNEKLKRLKAADLVVRLTWDTDGTDVDLHVTEPSGHETFYSARQSRSGNLDRDVTTGYGPETYTARRAAQGTYRIAVNYFSGGQKTKVTVTVIRHKDTAEEVTQKFEIKLEEKGERVKVMDLEWR